jgi:DNA mismatch endonuclease, patch repair protein
MARITGRDTSPELALRRRIWRLGLRYRLHDPRLPGRPDISLPGARVAVFVDGCFWHSCPRHGAQPQTRAEFWARKFERNRARDRRVDRELRAAGWHVLHVWEHEITESAERAALRVARAASDSRTHC